MIEFFDSPDDLTDAMRIAAARDLLPTDLGSADIAKWEAEIKQRSIFTARGTNATFLQEIKDVVENLVAGKINQAKGRELLKAKLDEVGYDPITGFSIDDQIEPAEPGSLRDISSEDRLDLILDTQTSQAANFAYYEQGQKVKTLHSWPCWELVRIAYRMVPRGERRYKGFIIPDPTNAWPVRWVKAGGTIHSGRMVARKDAEVWNQLGSPTIFNDGLGQPYPPFAFNSGMGFREVDRSDAIRIGAMTADDEVSARPRSLNEGAVQLLTHFDREWLEALKADLDVEVEAGRAELKAEIEEVNRAYRAAHESAELTLIDLMIDIANDEAEEAA